MGDGLKLATVSTPSTLTVSRRGFDSDWVEETRHDIELQKGKHLRCSCGGLASYRSDSADPGVMDFTCRHIRALYRRTTHDHIGRPLNVTLTDLGHQLFASIWAAHLLLQP